MIYLWAAHGRPFLIMGVLVSDIYNNIKKVIVGLSGGVDSAVAAYVLKEQGIEVVGATFMQYDCKETKKAVADAREIAKHLGIKHIVKDVSCDFDKDVIQYFASEYFAARTPNPCNMCNRFMKWRFLIEVMEVEGADCIATGHYADMITLENGIRALKKSQTKKDQTYALSCLTKEQIAKTIFPLSAYSKEEVRKIAEDIKLPVADKADSQDICFVSDSDYAKFIEEYVGDERYANERSELKQKLLKLNKEGDFVSTNGTVIGRHKGIMNYTIGQRKGLNLSMNHPVFVKELRLLTNEVVICDNDELFEMELTCDHLNPLGFEKFEEGMTVFAKIRYADKGTECVIAKIDGDKMTVLFKQKVRAITPGQIVAFYDGDVLVGSGRIGGYGFDYD